MWPDQKCIFLFQCCPTGSVLCFLKNVTVWTPFQSQPQTAELVTFAQLILTVANQRGCEWTFFDLKMKQTQCWNFSRSLTKWQSFCDDWCCQPINLRIFNFRLVSVSKNRALSTWISENIRQNLKEGPQVNGYTFYCPMLLRYFRQSRQQRQIWAWGPAGFE